MAENIPSIKLTSGYDFPMIGFGTFSGHNAVKEVYDAAKVALEVGYKHFDTAYIYETEASLGKAIKESGVPRSDLFITTKLWSTFHEPERVAHAFDLSLKNLDMDYVDLYLMHWPFSWEFKTYDDFSQLKPFVNMKNTKVPVIDTYREMEKLVKTGKARSIGVSNFTIAMLEELLGQCEIPPTVNQVELHPALPQEELVEYCKSKNIVLTAYSPLGNPGYKHGLTKTLEEPLILELAKKYNATPVQILLNWGVNRGYVVIPKSVTPERIKANLTYFKMDPKDVKDITELGRDNPVRTCDPTRFGVENDIF